MRRTYRDREKNTGTRGRQCGYSDLSLLAHPVALSARETSCLRPRLRPPALTVSLHPHRAVDGLAVLARFEVRLHRALMQPHALKLRSQVQQQRSTPAFTATTASVATTTSTTGVASVGEGGTNGDEPDEISEAAVVSQPVPAETVTATANTTR